MDTMSELLLLLVGILAPVILEKVLVFVFAPLFGRISVGTQITEATPSVRVARRIAGIIPNWIWQILTWTTLVVRYFTKSTAGWRSTAMYLIQFFAARYMAPNQKHILDTGLFAFTVYRACRMCQNDYDAFLALGEGVVWTDRHDGRPKNESGRGYLDDLEVRPGHRPEVVGIAPQRQLDQRSPKHVYDYLLTYLDHLVAENASKIYTSTSFLEQHTEALLAKSKCVAQPIFRTFGGEIVHPHKIDGSLHCMLHPKDIEMVIAAGWGERHSIARENSWWMFWFLATEGRPPIPEHLCFLYAPKNEFEVCVVAEIVEAGVNFVTGKEYAEDEESLNPVKGLVDMD